MTRTVAMLILAAIILARASTTFAATLGGNDGARVPGQTHAPAPASHAIQGVVKTVSSTLLVIARSGKRSDLTFVLDASTSRAGTIAPGATVSVRYRTEGDKLVATAVTSRVTAHQGFQ